MTARTLIFALLFTSQALLADEVNWSQKLSTYEGAAADNLSFALNENQKTNEVLQSSKNAKPIGNFIKGYLNREIITQTQTLKDQSILKLVDHGLGQATELIQVVSAGSKSLLSNFSYKKNNSVAFISFSVSPDERYVVVFSIESGSIDDYRLHIVDLSSGKLISDQLIEKGNGIVWLTSSKIALTKREDKSASVLIDIANSFSSSEESDTRYISGAPMVVRCQAEKIWAQSGLGGWSWLEGIPCSKLQKVIFHDASRIVLIENSEPLRVHLFQLDPQKAAITPTEVFSWQGNLQNSWRIDYNFIFASNWGPEQKLLILDKDFKERQEILVPPYASIKAVHRKIPGASLAITLASPVISEQVFEYNYIDNRWTPEPSEQILLVKNNVQYVSEIRNFTARDGAVVPMRFTYRSGIKQDSARPVLMSVYGGFDKAGKIYPQFDYLIRELFLNQGGVFVAPAIRGGGEFGSDWHDAATLTHKMMSFYDVIDAVDFLIRDHWTVSDKVIITGTSNGGLTVAASALLSPKSFGLVIPVSGVYDVEAFPRLDPRFADFWKSEYGDPAQAEIAQAMLQYSPLEIPLSGDLPKFLFINGRNDSRVNWLHSVKMLRKIRIASPEFEKTHAIFLNNAGHWIDSSSYQDLIAWREKQIIWTYIYDHLGWIKP